MQDNAISNNTKKATKFRIEIFRGKQYVASTAGISCVIDQGWVIADVSHIMVIDGYW